MITYEKANEWLSYNPETGVVTWLKDRAQKIKAGDTAGTVDSYGYKHLMFEYRIYRQHRIAWLLTHKVWPVALLDHINGDKADNRLCNLRPSTISENALNRVGHRQGRLAGTTLDKRSGRWCAQIRVDNKMKHLGTCSTELEAHQRYLSAVAEYNLTN